MATFTDLPNELVSEILWQAHPQDLESLSAVCRNVYSLATPMLQEHRKLKELYTSLEPPPPGSGQDVGNWYANNLITVLHNPRIALYVVDLHPTYWKKSWQTLYRSPDSARLPSYHLPYPIEWLDRFEHAVRTTDMIPPEEVDDWIAKIGSGDEDPIIALLLLHLPSLQLLRYDLYCQPSQEKVRKTIQRIVQSNDKSYLPQLREVWLDYESCWDHTESCNLSQACMLLPSVQSLHVQSLVTDDTAQDLNLSYIGQCSSVSELAFTGGFCGTNDLCQLVNQTKSLKKFTWETHEVCERYEQGLFNSFLLRNALMANACHTLESLTLRAQGYKTTSLGSLHQFESLRELDTDVAFLFNADGSDIFTWPNRLPSSLEKLCLALEKHHILQTPENFCEAFRFFARVKKEQTPRLTEILIRMQTSDHCREAYDHVEGPCIAASILLQHVHPSGSGHIRAGCGECEDCEFEVEQFLQETGGPQSHDP